MFFQVEGRLALRVGTPAIQAILEAQNWGHPDQKWMPPHELPSSCLFCSRSPAKAQRDRGMIELALDGIRFAPLIETEDFVAQVQPIGHDAEPLVEAIAGLNIVLRVRIQVLVAIRPFQPQNRIVGWSGVYPKIRIDARMVVAHRETSANRGLMVSEADAVMVRRLR